MKLQVIFDQLVTGELSQINLGGEDGGHLSEANYAKVARPIGLGLTALHKRFLLKEGTLYLDIPSGQTYFTLDSKFAVSNVASLEAVKYLDDVWSPFEDDLLKLERVIDVSPATVLSYPLEKDRELALNQKDNPDSCFTPSYKTLVIPSDLEATRLKLVYRADHIQLTEDLWNDPEGTEIELPFTHLEALCLFVASRMLNPTGFAGGNGFHEGNNYGAKFEAECALLETQNLTVDQDTPNMRLVRNGWA